jgi:hypothetical protein
MKQNTTKINFESFGIEFKNITVGANRDGEPTYRTMGGVGQCVRQYMKQRFPGVPFQLSTSSFSGGDAVDVYLSPLEVNDKVYENVRNELDAVFSEGRFNGMEDIYEYNRDSGIKDPVTGIEFGTKYMHVSHRPKYGTKQYEAYQAANENA